MAEHTLLDEQWVDILAPTPLDPAPAWPWLLLIATLIGLLLIAWRLHRPSPRQRALRQLRHCNRLLNQADSQPKQIAYLIYRAVLQVTESTPASTLQSQSGPDWQVYYQRLVDCAFNAQQPDIEQLRSLLTESHSWLAQIRH